MVIVNNFDNKPYTPEKLGNLNSKTAAGSCGSSDDRGAAKWQNPSNIMAFAQLRRALRLARDEEAC